MAGRSNLQQAVPITFGYKMATLLAGFERHQQRLKELRARVLVGEFGGAAGTLSSLGKRGLEVQAELMKELDLGQPAIAWHTMRDRIAEVGCFLGLVTGTCGKIAIDVKLMMQTEVEEVYEPFHEGRGSSSTMPQKRNPISSVYITALHRDGAPARGGAARRHGRGSRARDRPVGNRMDRAAGDFLPSAGALAQTRFLLDGPAGRREAMRANLDLTRGLIVSEAVMMGLGPHLGRQYAHDLVYDICRKVVATGRPLLDLLAENDGDHQAPRPRRAGEAVRSGELSRRRRRDGRPRAGDAGEVSCRAPSQGAAGSSLLRRRALRRGLLAARISATAS